MMNIKGENIYTSHWSKESTFSTNILVIDISVLTGLKYKSKNRHYQIW